MTDQQKGDLPYAPTIGPDNTCPITKQECTDECCPPGSVCNLATESLSDMGPAKSEKEIIALLNHAQQVPLINIEHLKEEKEYGLWQVCPKCNGEGMVADYDHHTTQWSQTRTCPVCNGAKLLVRPEIK